MKLMLVLFSLFTIQSQASQLPGLWKLDQFTMFLANGEAKPFCLGAQGTIQYGQDGRMSVRITCAQYRGFPAQEYGGFLFYAGPYEVRDGQVIHHIQRSNAAKLRGTDLVRKIEVLNAHQLVLSGKFGAGQSLRIRFRR